MNKSVYRVKRTFLKYDSNHIIGYLNETVIKDYQPEAMEGQEPPEPYDGYQYEGTEKDGGTIRECANPGNRDDMINAIIRTKYSLSEELAIHRHVSDDAAAYKEEWATYDAFCEQAKTIADAWLS